MDAMGSPLPDWARHIVEPGERVGDDVDGLDAAIDLAVASAEQGGGPFGVLVADADGRVVSLGWNRVIEATDSTAHAEIEALRAAQLRVGTHDLSQPERGPLSMFASCAPCVMCFGAIYWSGIARVVSAASAAHAEALGFDEGPVTEAMWRAAKEDKGIEYEPDGPARRDPEAPFDLYREKGGVIY